MRFIYTGLALFIAGVTAQNAPAGKVWGYNDFDYKGVKTTYDTPTTCENLQNPYPKSIAIPANTVCSFYSQVSCEGEAVHLTGNVAKLHPQPVSFICKKH